MRQDYTEPNMQIVEFELETDIITSSNETEIIPADPAGF